LSLVGLSNYMNSFECGWVWLDLVGLA